VSQCAADASNELVTRRAELDVPCDMARGAHVTARGDGTVGLDVMLFREILTYDGWVACEPCSLRVVGDNTHFAIVPVRIAAGSSANRPRVVIEEPPPHELGTAVTLRGSAFQPAGDAPAIGWCFFRSDDPSTEVQGDPAYGHAQCAYRPGLVPGPLQPDGSFVIEDFPLPDETFTRDGLTCADSGARCGLAEHRGEGSPPTFVTMLQMTR
jgi:hypothetical protein